MCEGGYNNSNSRVGEPPPEVMKGDEHQQETSVLKTHLDNLSVIDIPSLSHGV
jgi:hypothetical protein